MATRNITSQFLRLRKEIHEESKLLKYQSNVKDRLLLQSKESFASSSNQMEEAPVPQWLSCVNQMKDKRLAIHQNIDLLQKLYEKRFRVIFSETDLVRLDEEIEHKVHLIVALFKDMEKLLKSIQPTASMSEERRKLHQNIWLGNYHALKDLQSKFKQLQKAHLQYLLTEKSVEDSSPIGRILSSRDEVTNDMSTVSFTDTGLTPHQLVQVQNTEEMVHLRDSEIEQISKSVQDLAGIFQELAVMVRHQGTLLDRIDFNLEHAVVLVEDGEKQVVKAEKHQKQASSCTNTIIGLELAIAAMTGLLIWKETRAH